MMRSNVHLILLLKISMLVILPSCNDEIINSSINYEGFIGAVPVGTFTHSDVRSFGELGLFEELAKDRLSEESIKELIKRVNELTEVSHSTNYDFRSIVYLRKKNGKGIKICLDLDSGSRTILVGNSLYCLPDSFAKYYSSVLCDHFGENYRYVEDAD